MRKWLTHCFGCGFLFLVGFCHEASASGDLFAAYKLAESYDATYREAVSRVEAKRERRLQGLAELLPRLEVRGSADRVAQSKLIKSQSEWNSVEYDEHAYDVRFTQPLFDGEKFALFRKGGLEAGQAEVEFELARQDLILRVAQAGLDVLHAQDSLNALQREKEATLEFLDHARKSFKGGVVTASDVFDAEARFETITANVMQAEADLYVRRGTIRRIVGQSVDLVSIDTDAGLDLPREEHLDEWFARAAEENLEVQRQQLSVEIATAEVDRNKAGHYPRVELTARHNVKRQSATLSSFGDGPGQITDDVYFGIAATVPIFEGLGTQSRVREASYARSAELGNLDSKREQSIEAVREAFSYAVANGQRKKTLDRALSASENAVRASKLGYGVGVRSAVDVLNAHEQVSEVRRARSKALYDYHLYSLKLKAALGTLNEDDLVRVGARPLH